MTGAQLREYAREYLDEVQRTRRLEPEGADREWRDAHARVAAEYMERFGSSIDFQARCILEGGE